MSSIWNHNVTILNDGDAIFVLGLVALKTGGYQCIVCARQFSILHNGKRHFENVHENVDRRVACYICQAVYKNSSVLENHLRKAHGIYRSNWKKTSWTKKTNNWNKLNAYHSSSILNSYTYFEKSASPKMSIML